MEGFFLPVTKIRMKTVPDHHEPKTRLRKVLRNKRSILSGTQRAAFDAAINRHLIEFARTAQLSDVGAYLSFDGEPDLSPALQELETQGVTLALPVLQEHEGRNDMAFHEWTRDCELVPNRYGIMEPVGTREIPLIRFDAVLFPLVGWCRDGSRLGMGGSFYDRAFQPFAQNPRPLRMGVGYLAQECGEVPLDPWDIRLHAMLTEKGWFTCGR